MRIKKIRVKNFRSFVDETIDLDSYTCLVGANGAGKSTLLCALNVFFRESTNATEVEYLSAEDFHEKNTNEKVEITLTFGDLSKVAKEALSDYVRNDELIVSAVAEFDEAKGRAPVEQIGSRMGIPDLAEFFETYKSGTAAQLQAVFDQLKVQIAGIPEPVGRSKDAKLDAVKRFEADPANAHLLEPIASKDQFYGFAGASKLRAFVQWVYVSAVKDASDEQSESRDGALGKLLARTVRARVNFRERLAEIESAAQQEYTNLLAQNQEALDLVGGSLSRRMTEWSHPDVNLRLSWAGTNIQLKEPAAKVVAGERGFEGEIARFGHGFQRSYLLALLQELAEVDGDDAPTLLLGIEEPELYQHPPQARYLSQILQTLAGTGDQILITTHSPYFVGGANFERVRVVRKVPGQGMSRVHWTSHARFAERYANAAEDRPLPPRAIAAQINEVLRPSLNEMFFANRVVLVEGSEDAAYLLTWMTLTDRLPSFRRQGVHVVPVDGKSRLAKPLIVAQELRIPVFLVFDGDKTKAQDHRHLHLADNTRLLRILGLEGVDPFPEDARWGERFVQWRDEMSSAVDSELAASIGRDRFARVLDQARVRCGHAPSAEKNTFFIQHKLELAKEAGAQSASLDRLCDAILGEAMEG